MESNFEIPKGNQPVEAQKPKVSRTGTRAVKPQGAEKDLGNTTKCQEAASDPAPTPAVEPVAVEFLGERAMPMKYEVYTDGHLTKLTFGAGKNTVAAVSPEVADVLTGKTATEYDEKCRPINAVIVVGKVSEEDAAKEAWAVVEKKTPIVVGEVI